MKEWLGIIGWSSAVFGFCGFALWKDWPDVVNFFHSFVNVFYAFNNVSVAIMLSVPVAAGWLWFLPQLVRGLNK